MYLKALEIQGFKSFPEKTLLSFDKDITAIVGPNGSGKSNISDAICWVMGEQSSRALRGGKMEDVIFGGTEKRKPLGFAQVSLILDNSARIFDMDASEVMVTRRYYRSGESEYYINRKSVRLKDVNELFMDTGLGREGYAIIGQGRIDEILSIRSTDRRAIFEEAAGISRFRHRKDESERKLERTQENLTRVGDKIAELEGQVETLRRQSEVAKKYLVLRDELRQLEVSVWLETLDRLRTQSLRHETDHSAAAGELEGANKALEELYRAAESYSERMHEKDAQAERLQEEISALEAARAEAESAAAVLRANMEGNKENAERIRRDMDEQAGREGGLAAQMEEKAARVKELERLRSEKEAEMVSVLEQASDIAEKSGARAMELAAALEEAESRRAAAAQLRSRVSALDMAAQEMLDRDSASKREHVQINERLEAVRAEEKSAREALEAAREGAQSLQNSINGYSLRLAARRKRAGELSDRKMKLSVERDSLDGRVRMLAEMEREYEGYGRSVKSVMQEAARGALRGIHGPVANLISASDRYALAVETALGGSMQSVVVGTEEDGKAAINMLKRSGAGRATFLPVSVIRASELREPGLREEEGFEGVAAELASAKPEYEKIVWSLLGRTAVASDLDRAVKIARKYQNRFRIVTLDGQVINAGGSMTGGSAAKNSGILSRANELRRLRERAAAVAAELEKNAKELSEAGRELEADEYRAAQAAEEKRAMDDDILRLESAQTQRELLISAMEEQAAGLKNEGDSLSEKLRANEAEAEEARLRAEEYERREAESRGRAADLAEGREDLGRQSEELSERLAAIRAAAAGLEAEEKAAETVIGELSGLREAMRGGRDASKRAIDELERQNDGVTARIAEKERLMLELEERMRGKREERARTIEGRMELEAGRTARERELQEANRRILDLERLCAQLEQKKQAAELEEKHIIDKLWDSYELSHSAAESVRTELPEGVAKANRRIAELKKGISALGTPNIGAIEEFERVNERYTFLTDQRDDIERSKAELERIIKSITGEMRAIFSRQFEAINTAFKQTFLELFGGGRAELRLEDEEDVLGCGIEIHVQPPGKTLKTITLLSGGEKVFVAIALYFAILKVRPTPFCVMDEIEAALDEVNVDRCAEYLRTISDKTQFIVITHRRGTMEAADVLYGVTMQEQGVSNVLHVDLEEAEKKIGA